MEDKLRYVLSVRTLIEMTLIRASRIATTATIEELMRAVRELKAGGAGAEPPSKTPQPVGVGTRPAVTPPEPAKSPVEQPKKQVSRSSILDDKKLNDLLASLPGAVVSDIKEGRK